MADDSRVATAAWLIAAYAALDGSIRAALRNATEEEDVATRLRLLRQLRDELKVALPAYEAAASAWAETTISGLYESAARSVGGVGDGVAANAVIAEIKASVKDAHATMIAFARKLVTRSRSKGGFDKAVFGSHTLVGKEMRLAMSARGIPAVVYSNGARHTIRDYIDTLTRTAVVKAYNFGVINGAQSQGVEYFSITDGQGCGLTGHGIAPTANGLVVPASVALAWPLAHPRCQREISPVVNPSDVDQARFASDVTS